MLAFITAHGGIVAVFLVVLALYNITLSFLAQVFAALKIQEPAALQKAGEIGLKVSQWLSANTPTPAAPAPAPAADAPKA